MSELEQSAQIDALLQIHRRNLQLLERQIASYGGADRAPIGVLNQADQERAQVAELSRQQALLGGAAGSDLSAPYPGLLPFNRGQARLFCGRSQEAADLLALVLAEPLVAVIGASGSGKSSLVQAGLLPRLEPGWRVLYLTPGMRPLRSIADQLATLAPVEARLRLADELETRLFQRPDGLASGISTMLAEQLAGARLLVIVDQVEEMFTQAIGSAEEVRRQQRQFILNLKDTANVAGDRFRIVLTLRADFLGHWLNVPDIPRQPEIRQFLLRPMSSAARREAIVVPAERAGVQFEQGLVERLLADTRDQPAALPLLQFTLAQLWQLRAGTLLTHAAYEEIGGVSGALDRRASAIYSQLSESQQHLARTLFIRLVAMNESITYTRRRVQRDELQLANVPPAEIDRLINMLSRSDVCLIAAEADRLELAHEALIDHWNVLHGWLEANHDRLMALRRLTESAAEWRLHRRDPSFLYRGTRLAEARQVASAAESDINLTEQEFLARSQAAERRRWVGRVATALAAGVLALVVVAALAEIWPFDARMQWAAVRSLAGAEVTTLEFGADGAIYAGLGARSHTGFQLARSADGGRSWDPLATPTGHYVVGLRADPTDARRLYLTLERDGFFESTDQGHTWAPIGAGLPAGLVGALAVAPDGTLFIGFSSREGLYRRAPKTNDWVSIPQTPAEQILFLSWERECPDVAQGCLLVGTLKGLWRWDTAGGWAHLVQAGPVFQAVCTDGAIYTAGNGLFRVRAGVADRLSADAFSNIASIGMQPRLIVATGLNGGLWKIQPPGDQLQRASGAELALRATKSVFVARMSPEARLLLVGGDNGLVRGSAQRWYSRLAAWLEGMFGGGEVDTLL